MTRFLRSSFVIARRDFGATVLSKAFIFFLLGPLFPLLLGGLFGSISSRVATQTEQPVVAVVMSQGQFEALWRARQRLAAAVGEGNVVQLVGYAPQANNDALVKRLLRSRTVPVQAVLTGWFGDPRLVGEVREGDEISRQVAYLLHRAVLHDVDDHLSPTLDVQLTRQTRASMLRDRALTAQIGQTLLFFLTLMLSTMVLSQLIEEKSNKVIEIIAAAIPIDAMFVGKLFAMLAASVLALIVWISAGALLIQMIKTGGVQTLPPPAIGWAAFLALGVVYFGMNYLLFGAVFLMIGAQASTAREVQTMSLPATFAQVLLFGLASTAVGAPDSANGLAAAIFPLSSPMAMLARAADQAELWPHLAAILWQALWVALIVRVGAQLFRKTVLKSGPRRPWWKLSRA